MAISWTMPLGLRMRISVEPEVSTEAFTFGKGPNVDRLVCLKQIRVHII